MLKMLSGMDLMHKEEGGRIDVDVAMNDDESLLADKYN